MSSQRSGDVAESRPVELDYEAIEAAIMETARGRWFLAEHARRNRHVETVMLLGAMETLGRMIERQAQTAASHSPAPDTTAVALRCDASAKFIPSFNCRLEGTASTHIAESARAAQARDPAGPPNSDVGRAAQANAAQLLQTALVGDAEDTFDYNALMKVA